MSSFSLVFCCPLGRDQSKPEDAESSLGTFYPTDYHHRRLQRIDGAWTKIRVDDVAALANIPLGLESESESELGYLFRDQRVDGSADILLSIHVGSGAW